MSNLIVGRPQLTEHAPYYSLYIDRIADDDILAVLERQISETLATINIAEEKNITDPYAPDKWSVKQLIGHLNDTERVMSYRALRFARNDKTALSGFEQDDFIPTGRFDERSFSDLKAEFECIRRSTLSLFKHLDKEAWLRRGLANNNEISVRALAYVMAGHVGHHMDILATRYLNLK